MTVQSLFMPVHSWLNKIKVIHLSGPMIWRAIQSRMVHNINVMIALENTETCDPHDALKGANSAIISHAHNNYAVLQ